MKPPSLDRECRERTDGVETEEVEGVETDRSRFGTASRAGDGDTLGDGELGLRIGDAMLLCGGLESTSASAMSTLK